LQEYKEKLQKLLEDYKLKVLIKLVSEAIEKMKNELFSGFNRLFMLFIDNSTYLLVFMGTVMSFE